MVRRAGFCLRMEHEQFLRRYGLVSSHERVWPLRPLLGEKLAGLCTVLLSCGEASMRGEAQSLGADRYLRLDPLNLKKGSDFVVGKTKVCRRCCWDSATTLFYSCFSFPSSHFLQLFVDPRYFFIDVSSDHLISSTCFDTRSHEHTQRFLSFLAARCSSKPLGICLRLSTAALRCFRFSSPSSTPALALTWRKGC